MRLCAGKRITLQWFVIVLCGFSVSLPTQAALKLGSLFRDHMVLQRDMDVPVWGMAEPGSKVTVEFAKQRKTTVVNEDGAWCLHLDPLSASVESRVMTVYSSKNPSSLSLTNVVVGEVWLCSGQSNMQFGYDRIPDIKALESSAKNLRSFNVKRTVAFEEQAFCEGAWTTDLPSSAVAFSFAYFLEEAADVPVGIILSCWGSSSIEAWMPRDMTETVPHFKTLMAEFDANSEVKARIQTIVDGEPWSRKDDIYLRRQSNILYNAMMAPLAPYACRGIVWYQGERNEQSMFGMVDKPWFSRNSGMLKYADTLQQWILRLRTAWQRDDLQFLIVMLPGFHGKPLATGEQGAGPESPLGHTRAWIRESQLAAEKLPHTAVVNTIDLGNVKDNHPLDKLPVGQRLALRAQRDILGMQVEADGPRLKTVEKRSGTLIVHFDHAVGLTTKDGAAPKAFWIADDTQHWVPAEAVILGTTVVLSSPELKTPCYIRYAFAGKPEVNLVNKEGLPTYPFRTDDFQP